MPFGQSSGPPASSRQVQELLSLLQDAGHVDFRDARGPMGFTQRQANGKFTRAEAEAFVEQLQRETEAAEAEAGPGGADRVADLEGGGAAGSAPVEGRAGVAGDPRRAAGGRAPAPRLGGHGAVIGWVANDGAAG